VQLRNFKVSSDRGEKPSGKGHGGLDSNSIMGDGSAWRLGLKGPVTDEAKGRGGIEGGADILNGVTFCGGGSQEKADRSLTCCLSC
jgi:hypothetical protein